MKTFIDFQKEEVELDEVATPIKNKVQDRKTGKWYDPTKEFNKLMDKPEVKAQMKRMAKTDVKEEAELEEEQLDELSKDTLASYEKKSRVAAHKHALASELKGLAADPAGSYAHKMMADKRHAGWKVAVKKLHTEESDTPFEGPYKQSKGTVTDKSGAKHTPLSNVRSLARNAIEKMKQKMRMAHLSPEVRAEKLARNEELVGGQKKLDIDKDGKIEKSDLEVLRAKKLKEDVTTAAQKLKAALDRHTEHAVAANRAGDHDAVKVHQGYANKIKTQLGKLAKNEEVEIDEDRLDELSKTTLKSYITKATKDMGERKRQETIAINRSNEDRYKDKKYARKSALERAQIEKDRAISRASGIGLAARKFAEEVEIDEAAPTGIKIYHKGQDDKEAHSMVFSAADAAKHEKELKQQGRKVTGRAVMSGKTEGPRKNVTEEVELDEDTKYTPKFEYRQKVQPNIHKHFGDRKTAGAHTAITYHKQSDGSTHAKVQYRNISHTDPSGVGPIQHKHFSVNKDHSVTPIKINEEVEIEEGLKSMYHSAVAKHHGRKADAAFDDGDEESFKKHMDKNISHKLKAGEKVTQVRDPKKFKPGVAEEVEIKEAEMTDAEMANREKIVKGMKKSFKDFTTKYGDRAKEVMYATATKKAMEEEVEEELEEDMDEGVTTRNGAITVHKGTYGTSYQPNDDEDDEDTPEKKEPAVKRGRGRPAGAKSGAKPKGSAAGKSYGGVAIHSLRLPNNNK